MGCLGSNGYSSRQCVCSRFYQWYQWYTNIVQGSTNGTIGNTIGTNGNANGTIGSPNGTIGTIGKPMVPLATNGTIGKISNGTIGRTPNRASENWAYQSLLSDEATLHRSFHYLCCAVAFKIIYNLALKVGKNQRRRLLAEI